MADHLYKRVKTADAIPASAEITAKEAVTDGKSVIHPAIEWKRERKYEPATYEYRVFDMEFEFELEEDGENIDAFRVFEKWLNNSQGDGFGAAEDLPKMFDITAEYEAKTFGYSYKKEFYGTLDAEECADNNITDEDEASDYVQDNHDSLYPDEGDVDYVEITEEGSETVVLQVKN